MEKICSVDHISVFQTSVAQPLTHNRVCNLQFLVCPEASESKFCPTLPPSCPWRSLTDHTSHCKTNKYLIKVPLIVDGGHLAAVLRRVGSGGVEDQDVGRFSELSSVLQVPFFFFFEKRGGKERGGTLTIAHSHTLRVRKTTLAAKFNQGGFSLRRAASWFFSERL